MNSKTLKYRHLLKALACCSICFVASSVHAFEVLQVRYGATDGWADKTQMFKDLATKDKKIDFQVTNAALGGDPKPGVAKKLEAYIWDKGEIKKIETGENAKFAYTPVDTAAAGTVFNSKIEVVSARYGAQDKWLDVSVKVREMAEKGMIEVPAAKNVFFGSDPIPGVVKNLEIVIKNYAGTRTIVVPEREFFKFQSLPFDVAFARYGVRDKWVDLTEVLRNDAHANGFLSVPKKIHEAFGDPIPGVKKHLHVFILDKDGLKELVVEDFQSLFYIPSGTIVALKSVKWDKYLGVRDGKNLGISTEGKDNKACQFIVEADGKAVGFKSASVDNKFLHLTAGGAILFEGKEIKDGEEGKGLWNTRWAAERFDSGRWAGLSSSSSIAFRGGNGRYFSLSDTDAFALASAPERAPKHPKDYFIMEVVKPVAVEKAAVTGVASKAVVAAVAAATDSTMAAPAPVAEPREVVVPTGFAPEAGKLKAITMGSNANELEVWGIGFDNALYRFDRYSMSDVPWTKQEAKLIDGTALVLEDIACASDGTMVGVNNAGKSFKYNWEAKNWDVLAMGTGNDALDLDQIAVGHKDCIWATDNDSSTVYEYTQDKGWVARAEGIATFVAAGVDGTVAALNKNGTPFLWKDSKWHRMDTIALETIAVGKADMIMGIDKNANLLEYKDSKFVAVKGEGDKSATGFDSIAMNAVGTVFLTDEDGDLYRKGDTAVAVTVKKSGDGVITTREVKPAVVEAGKETRDEAVKKGKVKKKPAKKKTTGKKTKVTKAKTKKTAAKKTATKGKAKKSASKASAKKTAKKTTTKKSSAKKTTKKAVAKKAPAKK